MLSILKYLFSFFNNKKIAVINNDKSSLNEDIKLVRKKYGSWYKINGFNSYYDLFESLYISKLENRPYKMVFLNPETSDMKLEFHAFKKIVPNVKTIAYKDTANLTSILSNFK